MRLKILGSVFEMRCTDEYLKGLIEPLWLAALTDDDGSARPIEIRDDSDGWRVDMMDGTDWFCGRDDPWVVAYVTRHMILDAALKDLPEHLVLHAAVVSHEDAAVLIVGHSGAGKTTMAVNFLQNGWSYVADDHAVINREAHTLERVPAPLSVKDPQRWSALQPLLRDTWTDAPTASFLVPADAFPQALDPTKPRFIIFPTPVSSGETVVRQMTPAEATTRCCKELARVAAADVRLLGEICRGCESVEVTYRKSENPSDRTMERLPYRFRDGLAFGRAD